MLDLVSVYCIDGFIVVGEQIIVLENKECVEFFKGVVGLQVGVSSVGGIVNYVIKCLVDVCLIMLGIDFYGLCYLVIDLGMFFGEQKQFGLCINVVYEDIYFYVNNGDGWCDFVLFLVIWVLLLKMLV